MQDHLNTGYLLVKNKSIEPLILIVMKINYVKKYTFLILFAAILLAACNRFTNPNRNVTASISGRILLESSDPLLRIFVREVNTDQVTWVNPGEGKPNFTITDLPPGIYAVVGWFYPAGVSGAYTSLDTVLAVGKAEMLACEEAIVYIELSPGEEFSGADIGCWGGNFFAIAETHGQIRLEPNRWKLVELNGQAIIPGTGVTLMFENEIFFGSTGCNNYGGKYTTAPGGGLALEEIVKNEKLCIEPLGVMEQEDQFLAALTSGRRYVVLNSVLELINEEGKTVLKFDLMPKFTEMKSDNLVGKTWRLVSAPGLDEIDPGDFTLSFDGKGFSGTTSCRDYAGTYTTTSDRLRIGLLEMTTDVACEESMLIAEGGYTTLLESIEQYNILETQLELYTIQSHKLLFELVSE